jgi:hypothetical protein
MGHSSRDNTMTNLTSSRNNISKQTLTHGDKIRAKSKTIRYFELDQY